MSLDASIRATVGELELEVDLAVDPGELVVLLGPNGSGKSSLLRALAGLLPLSAGRVALGSDVLEDAGTGAFVPPERRPIGVVFQDYLLFPHLSALDNVAFGLRARRVARADAHRTAHGLLERVGLAHRAGARPAELSGGEAQRVALARALAVGPRLLLLDEPFAALDATARAELRRRLVRDLRGYEGVRLLVTHDPVEAMSLGDRIIVLERGRVIQSGTPAELSRHPRSRYVADLVGVNLYRGRAEGGRVEVADDAVIAVAGAIDGPVLASVHPRAVSIFRAKPEGSPRNVWPGVVDDVFVEGDRVRVRVEGALGIVAEVTPQAVAELELHPGAEVYVAVKATEVSVYPA